MSNVINIATGEPLTPLELSKKYDQSSPLTTREKNIQDLIETVVRTPGIEVHRGGNPMFDTMNLTLEEVEKCIPEDLRKRVDAGRLFFVLKLILDQKESIQRALSMAETESVS